MFRQRVVTLRKCKFSYEPIQSAQNSSRSGSVVRKILHNFEATTPESKNPICWQDPSHREEIDDQGPQIPLCAPTLVLDEGPQILVSTPITDIDEGQYTSAHSYHKCRRPWWNEYQSLPFARPVHTLNLWIKFSSCKLVSERKPLYGNKHFRICQPLPVNLTSYQVLWIPLSSNFPFPLQLLLHCTSDLKSCQVVPNDLQGLQYLLVLLYT